MNTLLPNKSRIASIDLLRGAVMIIMALDHTRDFFHNQALTGDPLDVNTTTPFLYFTRWITHLCAPTFVFLSGVSAWLQSQRKTKAALSQFLITRGLWLVFMELFIVTLGITGDIHYGFFVLQTIWSIGISMVFLGLVIWLPFSAVLAIGLIIVLGHNSLDFAEAARKGDVNLFWHFIHVPTVFPLPYWSNHMVGVFYPFLPWTGLMIVGYCFGRIFTAYDEAKRNRLVLFTGIGALLVFIILRAINMYGDPFHWSQQKDSLYTFLSFMNVTKYPPSLLYMCATLGITITFMALVKNTSSKLAKIIIVYGRVPFFYYILHFYLLHIINICCYISRGHTLAEGMKGVPGLPFKFAVPGEGYSLWVVYGIWAAVVIALYPLCKWYDNYKTNHREKWWLSYL
ncbi:MAG: DUF1624 domain-containing protein [Bacteroidetes bacterium]|nr:DUF1624 domain-containing protein [Bacteroidota bacterium]